MTVHLVGAGPGDPGLLTVHGRQLLEAADVVVHDRLVDPSILALVRPGTELIDVGKRPGEGHQEEINRLLIARARAGREVVRLKGGDPFLLGRGGEEIEALEQAGVAWQVVPGVTSAFAAPAAVGIPVTHRGLASAVTVVTGTLRRPGERGAAAEVDWEALARAGGTLLVLMGMSHRAEIAEALRRGGADPSTPVAVVQWATTAGERVERTTLDRLAEVTLGPPAVIVIGAVAGAPLGPGELLPLHGRTVVVTRPAARVGPTRRLLEEAGARVVHIPVTTTVGAADGGVALSRAVAGLAEYHWVVLSSSNAVRPLLDAVNERADVRALAGCKLAAVGPGTARALAEYGLRADLVPRRASAQGLVDELPEAPTAGRVLFPSAAEALETLPLGLRTKGWYVDQVEAYRTVPVSSAPLGAARAASTADAVLLAAPSAVRSWLKVHDDEGNPLPTPALVVCAGGATAHEARNHRLKGVVVASDPSPGALVEALVAALPLEPGS